MRKDGLCIFCLLSITLIMGGCKKSLNAVASLLPPPLVVVGDEGVLSVSLDKGSSWQNIYTATNQILRKVSLVSGPPYKEFNHFIVLGDSGIILLNTDPSAQKWVSARVQTGTDLSDISFKTVKFINENEGYALAWDGSNSRLFLSEDGGVTWADHPLTTPLTTQMYGMNGYDTVLFLGGENGTFSRVNLITGTNTNQIFSQVTGISTTGDIRTVTTTGAAGTYPGAFICTGSLRPESSLDSGYYWSSSVYSSMGGIVYLGYPAYVGRVPMKQPEYYYIKSDFYDAQKSYYLSDTVAVLGGTNGYFGIKLYNPSIPLPTILSVNYPNKSINDTIFGVEISNNGYTGTYQTIYAVGSRGLIVVTDDYGNTAQRITIPGVTVTLRSVVQGL